MNKMQVFPDSHAQIRENALKAGIKSPKDMERKEQERDRFAAVDVLEEKRFPDFGSGIDRKSFRKAQPFGNGKTSVGVGNNVVRRFRLQESQRMKTFGRIFARKFGLDLAYDLGFLIAQKKEGKQNSRK